MEAIPNEKTEERLQLRPRFYERIPWPPGARLTRNLYLRRLRPHIDGVWPVIQAWVNDRSRAAARLAAHNNWVVLAK